MKHLNAQIIKQQKLNKMKQKWKNETDNSYMKGQYIDIGYQKYFRCIITRVLSSVIENNILN